LAKLIKHLTRHGRKRGKFLGSAVALEAVA
jgi:hypothetical protein